MKADFQGLKSPEWWKLTKISQAHQNLVFSKANKKKPPTTTKYQTTPTTKTPNKQTKNQNKQNPQKTFTGKIIQNYVSFRFSHLFCHFCLCAMPCFMHTSFVPAERRELDCPHVPVHRDMSFVTSRAAGDHLWAVSALSFQDSCKTAF